MDHKLVITIPDEIYAPLAEDALKNGRTPEEEVAHRLGPSITSKANDENNVHVASDILERCIGSVSLGYATGTRNEDIDNDIVRELASTRE